CDKRTLADNLADYNTWQFGGEVGGPIVEDKAHFFVAVDIQQKSQSFSGNQLTGDDTIDTNTIGFTKATADRFKEILAQYGITNPGDPLAAKQHNPDRNVFAK